jgi:hypothetical protein
MATLSEHINHIKSLQALQDDQRSYETQLMDMNFSAASGQIGYDGACSYVSYLRRLSIATGQQFRLLQTYDAFKKAEIELAKTIINK